MQANYQSGNGFEWISALSPVIDNYLKIYAAQIERQALQLSSQNIQSSLQAFQSAQFFSDALWGCLNDPECVSVEIHENGWYVGGF